MLHAKVTSPATGHESTPHEGKGQGWWMAGFDGNMEMTGHWREGWEQTSGVSE